MCLKCEKLQIITSESLRVKGVTSKRCLRVATSSIYTLLQQCFYLPTPEEQFDTSLIATFFV